LYTHKCIFEDAYATHTNYVLTYIKKGAESGEGGEKMTKAEEIKLVYFNNERGERQNFWRLPDGSFEKADKTAKLYLKDRSTGEFRLIQG
jgi:hypothetical protein